jgi:hypothetical protein
MNYLGQVMTKESLSRQVGHINQIASITRYEITEGKAKGSKVIEIRNGGGLEFRVIESKGLSIYGASYKGINLDFLSKPGLVAPEYFTPCEGDFPRFFHGGLLYTCGMLNAGPAGTDSGSVLSQHGRIGQTPAEAVIARKNWVGDECDFEVSGEVREGLLFKENMVLRRHVSTRFGSSSIIIHDEVENEGFEIQPLMMLYHFNIGYPVLEKGARFVAPIIATTPRGSEHAIPESHCETMSDPVDGGVEEVFYHKVSADSKGRSKAGLLNDMRKLGVVIEYETKNLPNLVEWKSMVSGDYVVGIEPANCLVDSRAKERERGTLRFIEPKEVVAFDLEFNVLDGKDELDSFEASVERLRREK